MPHSFICQYCGNPFERIHKGYKYCCRRCAYDDRIGKPRHPNAGKKRTKKPTRFTCQHCSEPFERMVYPSSKDRCSFLFCSPSCRNKARTKPKPKIPCPVCGTLFFPKPMGKGRVKQNCSQECAIWANAGRRSPKQTPTEIKAMITQRYPNEGATQLAKDLGMTTSAVQQVAYKEGVTLSDEYLIEHVHKPTSERMKANNPMYNPATVEKVQEYYHNHPEEHERIITKLMEGNRRIQKGKPTNLEKQLFRYLDELDIGYEPFYLVKPKFVVDVKINNLIIQADGDYWHGHPSREPLTERQKAQQRRDRAQDKYLTTCGYTVVRIWESDMSKELVTKVLEQHGILSRQARQSPLRHWSVRWLQIAKTN